MNFYLLVPKESDDMKHTQVMVNEVPGVENGTSSDQFDIQQDMDIIENAFKGILEKQGSGVLDGNVPGFMDDRMMNENFVPFSGGCDYKTSKQTENVHMDVNMEKKWR